MTWWMWTLAVYFVGFILTMIFGAIGSPNATIALAVLRAVVWPVYWCTGWPQGVPLPMD